jgi:transposase InsO family protein
MVWRSTDRKIRQVATRRIIEAWRIDDNTSRLHSALGYATPEEFTSSVQGHTPGQMTKMRPIRA